MTREESCVRVVNYTNKERIQLIDFIYDEFEAKERHYKFMLESCEKKKSLVVDLEFIEVKDSQSKG